jgi:hypothetical protein
MAARDIFISHSSGDAEIARALRAVLEAAGYSCWMAPDDIVGTDTWTEQILGAIADSKAMIVLVSAASNRSQHVSREVNLALGKERAVLPIRIENVAPGGSLEYLLSLVQRVDAFPPPIADHGDRIVRRLGTFLERPTTGVREPAGAAIGAPEAAGTVAATPAPPPTTSPPPPAAVIPPPAAVVPPPPAAAVMPPGITVTPTSVVMPGLTVARPAARSGPPMALLIGGGAVALVLAVVLGAGLLNPGSSPNPSSVVIASPTTAGTVAPTTPPATVAPTPPLLSAEEQLLQSTLPAVAAGTDACTSWPTPPGGQDVLSPSGYAASSARLTCPGPSAGGPATEFALYPTKATLDADYDAIMTSQGVAAGGACVSAIPANAPWNFPNFEVAGDLACFERDGRVQYVWTDHDLRVLGQWLAPDNATGLAFWQSWTKTLNPVEAALLADLPASVDDLGPCIRAADRYYEAALAILACPRATGQSSVFYARFPSASTFPNDPMTTLFDSILTDAGFADDTTTGCYDTEPVSGRYTWGYNVDGGVGSTEGYLGCYERTDTTPPTSQYVWTANKLAIMGLWNAPDLEAGISFFDDWIGEIR